MHGILAENLDGWMMGAVGFLGGLPASVLALGALFPAVQRKRGWTFALATPAFVVGLLGTVWVGHRFITIGLHDPGYSFSDFLNPWLMLAGPSLATSLLAVVVLGWNLRRTPAA
jgi:hypothetical protein